MPITTNFSFVDPTSRINQLTTDCTTNSHQKNEELKKILRDTLFPNESSISYGFRQVYNFLCHPLSFFTQDIELLDLMNRVQKAARIQQGTSKASSQSISLSSVFHVADQIIQNPSTPKSSKGIFQHLQFHRIKNTNLLIKNMCAQHEINRLQAIETSQKSIKTDDIHEFVLSVQALKSCNLSTTQKATLQKIEETFIKKSTLISFPDSLNNFINLRSEYLKVCSSANLLPETLIDVGIFFDLRAYLFEGRQAIAGFITSQDIEPEDKKSFADQTIKLFEEQFAICKNKLGYGPTIDHEIQHELELLKNSLDQQPVENFPQKAYSVATGYGLPILATVAIHILSGKSLYESMLNTGAELCISTLGVLFNKTVLTKLQMQENPWAQAGFNIVLNLAVISGLRRLESQQTPMTSSDPISTPSTAIEPQGNHQKTPDAGILSEILHTYINAEEGSLEEKNAKNSFFRLYTQALSQAYKK